MKRWHPKQATTKQEKFLLKRLKRTRKLFAFLRLHRHELFDDEFQAELEGMYRKTGAGAQPLPPAQLCMVLLLQGYLRVSDAEAVELAVVDLRWQMVLDCLGAREAPFSQGALPAFRERLIGADLDRRLLERTVELARRTKEFDWKKLPKDLRLAVDSRPLQGAGRVEDTINLLGHAARKVVQCAAHVLEKPFEEICQRAGIPLLKHSSVKAGLDIDWSDPEQKDDAIDRLTTEITKLVTWIERQHLEVEEPLRPYLEAIAQVEQQNLETVEGKKRIQRIVAEDRRVSIEDPQMRHGRKSRSKRFNGYKQHVASDLDTNLILACTVMPANRPEEEATPELKGDLDRYGRDIDELSIDRAFVNSELAREVVANGGTVVAKPWTLHSPKKLFTKADFKFDLRAQTITCPAGQVEHFEMGGVVKFDPELCGACSLRSQCTHSASAGRHVQINEDERLQHKLRQQQGTRAGRARLRERVAIEHRLAHVAARQGPRARYKGTRKNVFDLRRAAAIQNLENIQRTRAAIGKLR